MKILAIETSCDETGVCVLQTDELEGGSVDVSIIANKLASQTEDHQEHGGVFPTLAKRLHARNLPPLIYDIFKNVKTKPCKQVADSDRKQITRWLSRHPECADKIIDLIEERGTPDVDAIAVTVGPGLAPALWVGCNVARSIGLIADVPIVPVNHMAGHFFSALAPSTDDDHFTLANPNFPRIALLVSGGHTELIKQDFPHSLQKLGQTRDDAAGEAFDKIGRLLGLSYPAGPRVSKLADQIRNSKFKIRGSFSLPRPMIDADNLDFSFAGLKTAARKQIESARPINDQQKQAFAYELESTIVDVLTAKTEKALKQTEAGSLLAGGGVVANPHLRKRLTKTAEKIGCNLHICPMDLATDNAVMIGIAGWYAATDDDTELMTPGPETAVDVNDRLSL
jgi:N6-L-threonylcarbamoyladenine synthase